MSAPTTNGAPAGTALTVEGLTTSFFTYRGVVEALRDVSFDLRKGEMLGIVGETGSGKTVLVHSIVGQVRFPGRIVAGRVVFDGHDLSGLDDESMRRIRGKRLAVIGSNPRQALDPLTKVGVQLGRAIKAHEPGLKDDAVRARVLEALESVRIPDAKRRHDAYPHELSVGMAQRVIIAMAMLHHPDVILADEPTAGLDVTVQRQVLVLMKTLLDELGSSTMIVTRDLGIVAHFCDRIAVMQQGRLVESTDVRSFFRGPAEEESRRLLERTVLSGLDTARGRIEVVDRPAGPEAGTGPEPLLSVRGLVKHFPISGSHQTVKAVNDVSFDLMPGEALGLVGESGSGKTTVGRLVLRLIEPTAGTIEFEGRDLTQLSQRQLAEHRSRFQMVFQEPHASLNPNMTVARNIEDPLRLQREGKLTARQRAERVRELVHLVQLTDEHLHAYPHNLSAGQAQRVGVARAIATNPRLVVLDEPTSLLDISIRGEILDLLNRVKEEIGIAYIFISHDLTAVRSVCSRIAIMYLGEVVEVGDVDDLFAFQRHPYSRALLASVLYADPDARLPQFALAGEIPSPVDLPTGCFLASRCPLAKDDCRASHPQLVEQAPRWSAACFHSDELVALEVDGEA